MSTLYAIGAGIAACLAFFETIRYLADGEAGRGSRVYKRNEQPGQYWLTVAVPLGLSIAFAVIAVGLLQGWIDL